MEPRIQYAKTSDGVSIAFWTLGEGMTLVEVPPRPWSHIQLEWQIPEIRRWYERLAEKRVLVRYDGRGNGLSQRDVADHSLDAHVLDLEAVVDRLGLESFALFAPSSGGPVAIAYAARHPERVSHLILWCTYPRASDYLQSPQLQALELVRLADDWELFTETLAHEVMGWSEGEPARRFAALMRESVTPEGMQAAMTGTRSFDVMGLLQQVSSPTLVLHRRQLRWMDVDLARRLASGIPNARMALLEGASVGPWLEDTGAVLQAIDEFLREGEQPTRREAHLPSGTAVILFADIADSTGLTERLGDTAFRERARELDGSLRAIIREHAGTPIEGKLLGDGVLAVFTSARQALEAALRCGKAGDGCGLPLHLGVHAGDVIREENNVYGGAVNVAARIAAASAPGEVLVSQTVRDLARTSAGVSFEDRGEQSHKGVADPMRMFAVRAREEA